MKGYGIIWETAKALKNPLRIRRRVQDNKILRCIFTQWTMRIEYPTFEVEEVPLNTL